MEKTITPEQAGAAQQVTVAGTPDSIQELAAAFAGPGAPAKYHDVVPAIQQIAKTGGDAEECQNVVDYITKHGSVPPELLLTARNEATSAIGMLKASVIALGEQSSHVSSLSGYYGAAYTEN